MLSDNQNLSGGYGVVSPSDSAVVGFKALYIGTTGNVVVRAVVGGTSVTFFTVPVGFFPVSGAQVMAATTAGNIVALF